MTPIDVWHEQNDYRDYMWKQIDNAINALEKVEYPSIKIPNRITVKKVVFNPPATIIIWNDGSKSVVKAQNGEPFDPEKGFVMAYLKKLLGNDNTFNKEITKWVKYEEPKVKKTKATFIPYDKPLTTEQILTMNGARVWVFSLSDTRMEMDKHMFNGWYTVDVEQGKLISDTRGFYNINENDIDFGFHAYLEPTRGCFG